MSPPQSLFRRTHALIEEQRRTGLHLGAQLYVWRRGEVLANDAIGDAGPGVAMTPGTLMPWMSCTKPLVAVAVARLWERGTLELDDPVARHLPPFATNGKDRVTIRHLLTHTGGFPVVNTGWPAATWDQIIQRICEAPLKPGWVPGRRAAYHAQSSWFILGRLVEQFTGSPCCRHVRDLLAEFAGTTDAWLAMSTADYEREKSRIGAMFVTSQSEPVQQETSRLHGRFHDRCSPAGGGIGTMQALGAFYAHLLECLARRRYDGGRHFVLSAPAMEACITRQRVGIVDEVFKRPMDWGLGFIIDSNHYGRQPVPYGFGPHCSPRTFGHGGHESSVAFADPEHGLVVAWVCNGMPGAARHDDRNHRINAAIYEDLGLA